MEKYDFIDAINALEKQHRFDSEFGNTMSKYFSDSFGWYKNHWVTNALVGTLQKCFNDDKPHSWIEYFCWECDFGKKDMEVKVNGKPFELTTPEHLYNLLVNED